MTAGRGRGEAAVCVCVCVMVRGRGGGSDHRAPRRRGRWLRPALPERGFPPAGSLATAPWGRGLGQSFPEGELLSGLAGHQRLIAVSKTRYATVSRGRALSRKKLRRQHWIQTGGHLSLPSRHRMASLSRQRTSGLACRSQACSPAPAKNLAASAPQSSTPRRAVASSRSSLTVQTHPPAVPDVPSVCGFHEQNWTTSAGQCPTTRARQRYLPGRPEPASMRTDRRELHGRPPCGGTSLDASSARSRGAQESTSLRSSLRR
mmetsp:Transcript_20677/g.49242  ORF Transcript_20677/g.49242 Transcript_20677/m.49242 type:complete len:261 (-) Transcript_20677:1176-1958(-)